jgi:hypothetical protein
MALLDVLSGILNGLSPQLTSSAQPQPGQLVTATIVPLPDRLQATDIVTGELDLTWVGKDVMYGDSDLEPSFAPADLDLATIGPKPITGATGIIGGISGTPGLLGQLKGGIPIAAPGTYPVSVHVTWRFLDEHHNPLPASQYSAPGGVNNPDIAVAFAPETTELTDGPPPAPRERFLQAEVSLSAGSATTPPRTLPELPVLVPALPIPSVLALFLHANFAPRSGDDDGAVLVVVPGNSPLRSLGQLQPVLNTLQSTIGNLTSFGSFATFLLGLSDLTHALSVQANVQFRATDVINNLNDITLIQRSWYENDTEAEDELSSLILIAHEGKGVKCFNDRDRDDGEGQFTIRTTANLYVIVRDLDGKHPAAEGGSLLVDKEPPGGWFDPDRFNDELSSLEFA